MNSVMIRSAEPRDRQAISALLDAAFGSTDESVLVDKLAADNDILLELVTEQDGRLVGHIAFSRLWIKPQSVNAKEDVAAPFAAVALAPLAVAPDTQRQGIGAALIAQAHAILRERSELLSVVVGDPEYYGRFGYRADLAASLQSDYPPQYVQALFLGNYTDVSGRMVYAAAFEGL